MTAMTDWLSLGLGLIQVGQGMNTGGNGVSVQSDALSYHVGNFPAKGKDLDQKAIVVRLGPGDGGGDLRILLPSYASISLMGTFKTADEGPPVLANVRLRCDEQSGEWGTGENEPELDFKADGLATPVGTAEDPHLQFQCRLELKIPLGLDNVIMHFVLDVNQLGYCQFLHQDFEYGWETVTPMGSYLEVYYDGGAHR